MAFTKVADGFYNCLQSDIDIFATPEEDATYFCLDSGATYRGVKEGSYPVVYKLVDIERRKIRSANPICMSQDLPNFTGRKYKVKEIPLNLICSKYRYYKDGQDYVRQQDAVTNSGESAITETLPLNMDKVIVCVSSFWNNLSAGSIKITTSGGTQIWANQAITSGGSEISEVLDFSETTEAPKLIVAGSVDCVVAIIDTKWLKHASSDLSKVDKVLNNVYVANVVDSDNNIVDYLYNINCNANNQSGGEGYEENNQGIFCDVETTKFNNKGIINKELVAPAKNYKISGYSVGYNFFDDNKYPSEYDVFVAEILD